MVGGAVRHQCHIESHVQALPQPVVSVLSWVYINGAYISASTVVIERLEARTKK